MFRSMTAGSDPMHGIENIFMHHVDLHAHTVFFQLATQIGEPAVHPGDIYDHHHDKELLEHRLSDLYYIGISPGADIADHGQDTHSVPAYN